MFIGSRIRAATASILLLGVVSLGGCSSSEDRAQDHYERGVELAANGEPVKAALEFRNAIRLNKDFVEAIYALGQVEEARRRFPNAVKLYMSVAERAPDHVEARVRLANILLAAGDIDAALKYADEALALAGDEPVVLVAKAAVELKMGNNEEAIGLANQALEADPERVDALMVLAAEKLRSGEAEQALALLDKAPPSSETNVALQLFRLTALEVVGDQEGVEGLLVKLTELFPETAGFRQALVRWYLSKDRKDDAELALRNFAASSPDDEAAVFGLVSYLNVEKGPAAAVEELENLISSTEIENDMRFRLQIALARLQFSSGEKSAAIGLMQSVLTDVEGDKLNQARVELARMYASDNNLSEAEQLVDEVITADAKNPDALGLRAQIRLEDGRIDEATDDLLAAVNEAPEDGRLRLVLGDAYERAGLVTLAEDQYAKALALNDNPAEAGLRIARFHLRYGRTNKARQVMEDVATRAPADRRVLALLGDLRLSMQDWVGAEEIAKRLRALDNDSNAAVADKLMASALSGMERHSDSINLLKEAVSADDQALNVDLVRAYFRAGQLAEAEEYLKTRLATDPENIQAHVLLGSIYASTERPEAAEDAFKRAAAAEEGEVGTTALAQFYASTGRMDDAEATARAGIERNPKSTALRFLLSAILQRSERFDEAITLYEDMFEDEPESTAIANDLASLLSERRGDAESLDRAYEIAQRFRNSEIPQYLDTLGWIHYLRGEYASALPLIQSAADRLPNVGLVHYHLGMVQKALDQTEDSIGSLEKAISLSATLAASDLEAARTAIEEQRQESASN